MAVTECYRVTVAGLLLSAAGGGDGRLHLVRGHLLCHSSAAGTEFCSPASQPARQTISQLVSQSVSEPASQRDS